MSSLLAHTTRHVLLTSSGCATELVTSCSTGFGLLFTSPFLSTSTSSEFRGTSNSFTVARSSIKRTIKLTRGLVPILLVQKLLSQHRCHNVLSEEISHFLHVSTGLGMLSTVTFVKSSTCISPPRGRNGKRKGRDVDGGWRPRHRSNPPSKKTVFDCFGLAPCSSPECFNSNNWTILSWIALKNLAG